MKRSVTRDLGRDESGAIRRDRTPSTTGDVLGPGRSHRPEVPAWLEGVRGVPGPTTKACVPVK
ncbi:hypothetical protein SGL43_07406 [Streptomyces globisporus]|uniref:Uncharacterized protein n=1 Tax=Streptomyces globisporus TaxID=1908 RepID=A0ABN8VGG0_STRGL|nr:hypothetical protein SGL43_07406 [Streptomyces globisporus]